MNLLIFPTGWCFRLVSYFESALLPSFQKVELCECMCCITSCTGPYKDSPNASRIARPAPSMGWMPVLENRRMVLLGLVLGVVVRVADPGSSWLALAGRCRRISLLPSSFRILCGVVEHDGIGCNSRHEPVGWLAGLDCVWGLVGFDLVETVTINITIYVLSKEHGMFVVCVPK
jgi:hypothetical protein